MIDLLQIPGTWQRPNPPDGYQDHNSFDNSTRNVILYVGGEADWQYRAKGVWSSSGHWKIVQGFHLSISAINPDPRAIARGESHSDFYYHLVAVEDNRMILLSFRPEGATDLIWTRLDVGRKFGEEARITTAC